MTPFVAMSELLHSKQINRERERLILKIMEINVISVSTDEIDEL